MFAAIALFVMGTSMGTRRQAMAKKPTKRQRETNKLVAVNL